MAITEEQVHIITHGTEEERAVLAEELARPTLAEMTPEEVEALAWHWVSDGEHTGIVWVPGIVSPDGEKPFVLAIDPTGMGATLKMRADRTRLVEGAPPVDVTPPQETCHAN